MPQLPQWKRVAAGIVASGMGKAGLVARRVVATLCSTGTPAVYLHPAESAHGDLGVLAPEDRLIAFSTSGKRRKC
jgi:arabinose-5-phosphate isomerase